MKKLILFLTTSIILISCSTQKGYNYSKHRKSGNQMNKSTQRVNKHNYNQLHHKCSPKKHRR